MKRKTFITTHVTGFLTAFLLIFGSLAAVAFSNQDGIITSVQNGSDDKPVWKVSGI